MHIWNSLFSYLRNYLQTEKKEKLANKRRLAEHLIRLRYNTKFHLQLCAILSQLNEHEAALQDAKNASDFWQESLKFSHDLWLELIKEKVSDVQGNSDRKVGKRKISKSENRQSSISDQPYESTWKKNINNAFCSLNSKQVKHINKTNIKTIRK